MLIFKSRFFALAFVVLGLVALGGEASAFDGQKVLEGEVVAVF